MTSSLSPPKSKPTVHSYLVDAKDHRRARTLNDAEEYWSDRYDFLLSRGYLLRPRYRPGWSGSWLDTTKNLSECEDSLESVFSTILDATRFSDGMMTCIKRIEVKPKNDPEEDSSDEIEIAKFLSSPALSHNDSNHCVTVIDSFQDPMKLDEYYMVMPMLRTFDEPEFGAIGEVVDFVGQILEGMEFMHSHLVAHGDLTGPNIMMDARPIFPRGWHFADETLAPDGIDTVKPLARIDHRVRYIIIDYDNAVRFHPGESHLIRRAGGRDQMAPELTSRKEHPYDAFKLDVFTLGNLFYTEFLQLYHGLDFLISLTDMMMLPDFRQRCTAQDALQYWSGESHHIDRATERRWLRKRDQSVGEFIIHSLGRFWQ